MTSISGVQRRTTASEGARRFITTELLTSRLRRESDREKINELLSNNGKFQDYLIATGVIHLYHYVGLKTQDLAKMSESMFTLDAEKVYEKTQKDHLFAELKEIVQNFIFNELEIFEKQLNLELGILNNIFEKDESKDPRKEQIFEENNKKLMHKTLISLFRKYNNQFFYDFIGRIYDLAEVKRNDILIKAGDLKATSLEIEQELKKEYDDDEKFIELITFNHLKNQINKMWELKGDIKQLETQKVALNKIQSDILKKIMEGMPFSKMGLKAKKSTLELKLDIVNYIKTNYTEQKNLTEIENEISKKIRTSLLQHATEGPQLFLNFLSEYLSMSFDEVVEFLKDYQVSSVPAFCQALSVPVEPIKQKLFELQIGDRELSQLSETGALNKVKTYFQNYKARHTSEFITGLTIYQLYENESQNIDYIKSQIEKEISISSARAKQLLEFENQLNKEILIPYEIEGVSQLRLILNLQAVLSVIEKDLFYSNFRNFLLFFSRIIELYQKIKKDKEIFLMAFKRISDLKSGEKWIQVKLEDLIIEKIMKRQAEIQELSLKYDPLYINSLIFARLTNESFDKAKKDLTTTKSPIFRGVLPIPIKYDNLPPISYATAYDLLMRIEEKYFAKKKTKEAQIEERKKVEKEEKQAVIQDVDTYSWIEKRINMSLMRMGKVDPTSLYWNEKDSDKLSKFILLHAQVKKGSKICSIDGNYVQDKCPDHPDAPVITAGVVENVAAFYKFAIQKIKEIDYSRTLEISREFALEILKERGKTDVSSLVEGEIQELGRKIGDKLGKLLNNKLYKTWKKKKLGR